MSTAANVEIDNASHVQETKNLLLDMSELLIEAYAADQQFQAKALEFDGALDSIEGGVQETARARQYFQHSPANDPSFRMVRDSSRMQLAKQMEKASRLAYLTARRAEYEYAARLSASNFRISDIYRSRTAEDILLYLRQLADLTTFFSGGHTYDTNPLELRFSVAKYLTSD